MSVSPSINHNPSRTPTSLHLFPYRTKPNLSILLRSKERKFDGSANKERTRRPILKGGLWMHRAPLSGRNISQRERRKKDRMRVRNRDEHWQLNLSSIDISLFHGTIGFSLLGLLWKSREERNENSCFE